MTQLNINGWQLTFSPIYRGPSYATRKAGRAMTYSREYLRKRFIFASEQAKKYHHLQALRMANGYPNGAKFYQGEAAYWASEAADHQREWYATAADHQREWYATAAEPKPRFIAKFPYSPNYIVGENG